MELTRGPNGESGDEHEQRSIRYTSEYCTVSDRLEDESMVAMIPQEVVVGRERFYQI
jgi:hypothetical protein